MSRSASTLGSWGDKSAAAEDKNRRLQAALKQNRERIPDEWFDKQYAQFAKRDAAVRKQTAERLEARRRRCEEFAATRRRALDRVYSDLRPQEQAEREELRQSFEHRMAESHARLAEKAKRQEAALLERKQRHEEDIVDRRNFFADAHSEQEKRAAAFQRLADERPKAGRQAMERRLSEVSAKAQRRQALQLEAQQQRERYFQEQHEENQALMERQTGLSEWLKDLDGQKKGLLWQRKVDGVASSLQRQSIVQSSQDAWHETLRCTPLPDDPKELQQLAQRMTPQP